MSTLAPPQPRLPGLSGSLRQSSTDHAPPAAARQLATRRKRRPPSSKTGGFLLYWLVFSCYVAIGMILSLHYNFADADGPSRVANAGYVLFSRDPHLAAIGFVWNPLPSMVDMPILLFSHFWPPLLTRGQAGTFQAAFFMAGAAVQVRGIALDRGVPSLPRWLLVGGFVLDPMIVLYGGNGMSEAAFIFLTLWAVRRLLRWMRTDRVTDLVTAGLALGLDYTARYEAAAAAAAVTVAVIAVTALRTGIAGRMNRFRRGLIDGTVVAFPFAVSFFGWTLASWITTGAAFPQFSSQYGNSSQVSTAAKGIKSFDQLAGGPLEIIVRDTLHLEPLMPLVMILVALLAVRRAELDGLMPMAAFGGILAFESYTQVSGVVFPWFRFFIMSIPLTIVLLILLWPAKTAPPGISGVPPPRQTGIGLKRLERVASRHQAKIDLALTVMTRLGRAPRKLFRVVTASTLRATLALSLLAALVVLPAIPITWLAMLNPVTGTQTSGLVVVSDPRQNPIGASPLTNNWYLADYLDRLHLPDGTVLMDTFIGWDVWLAAADRKQFVITSDYSFLAALNAPYENGIRYILVSDPTQDGGADAINRRYPHMYANGAGIAHLVITIPSTGDDITWRLYKVNTPS